jgi:arginyl-tRNA synthetase
MLKEECLKLTVESIKEAIKKGEFLDLQEENIPVLNVEVPKNREFGDFAINISALSRFSKKPPFVTAKILIKYMDYELSTESTEKDLEKFSVTVVGGYINFKIKQASLNSVLNNIISEVLTEKTFYGKNNIGKGEKVLLEYVSANPTGPFHIGHGRWAAVGSTLANVMKYSGFDVFQEFYVNDAGNQINKLGKSLYIRVMKEMGLDFDFPKDEELAKNYYTGDYLIDCAQNFIQNNQEFCEKLKSENKQDIESSKLEILKDFAKKYMLEKQKALLEKFETHFDNFYFETSLHERGDVQKCLEKLKELGKLYEDKGAIWFKSSDYGDDEDRVIKKQDGAYTYLTADIAYHFDKLKRGYSKLINIWGADHHGYIARIKASIEALGYNPNSLVVLLGQLVNLSVKGEQVRMGKRTKMVTLDELIDEVGVDATRFWMIMRDINNTLEFDVELAKSQSDENPVFYCQYAHARACSILRNAVKPRQDIANNKVLPAIFSEEELNNYLQNQVKSSDFDILWQNELEYPEIQKLIEKLAEYKNVVISAAKNYEPYLLTKYLRELAATFHKFYSSVRILSDDKEIAKAKIAIVQATIYVLRSCLTLIGASAPEKM